MVCLGPPKARTGSIGRVPVEQARAKSATITVTPMTTDPTPDYSLIDRTGLGSMIFYPRGDGSPPPESAEDHQFEVSPGVRLGARLYVSNPAHPTVLYFHGNGEVASDHDDIAGFYRQIAVNLFVVEFRGYGRSAGT